MTNFVLGVVSKEIKDSRKTVSLKKGGQAEYKIKFP